MVLSPPFAATCYGGPRSGYEPAEGSGAAAWLTSWPRRAVLRGVPRDAPQPFSPKPLHESTVPRGLSGCSSGSTCSSSGSPPPPPQLRPRGFLSRVLWRICASCPHCPRPCVGGGVPGASRQPAHTAGFAGPSDPQPRGRRRGAITRRPESPFPQPRNEWVSLSDFQGPLPTPML